MATEKLHTIDGVEISTDGFTIEIDVNDYESPATSKHISILVSEWEQIVSFINRNITTPHA